MKVIIADSEMKCKKLEKDLELNKKSLEDLELSYKDKLVKLQ